MKSILNRGDFMSYKIAVASSDGKVVNQHFGHSRRFIIFEVDGDENWGFVEDRITTPACSFGEHDESSMQSVVKLLSDCSSVIVSQIGFGAVQELKTAGINAFTIPKYIDKALQEVIRLNFFEKVENLYL